MQSHFKFASLVLLLLAIGCNTALSPAVMPQSSTAANSLTTITRQEGVTLQVVLPRETFWASEIVQAQVKVQNEGSETFAYKSDRFLFQPVVINEGGDSIVEDPWQGILSRGSGGPHSSEILLKPGDVVTRDILFQVPATPNDHSYALWVTARLNRPDKTPALKLQAGPIQLPAFEPDAAHQLRVHLKANKDGYELKTTDGFGNAFSAPTYGIMQIGTPRAVSTFGFDFDTNGIKSSKWEKEIGYARGSRIDVWVWADDHAVNKVSISTPKELTSAAGWIAPRPDKRTRFETIQGAHDQLALQFYVLRALPAGAELDTVLGQSGLDDGGQRFVLDAYYRLADGSVMKFSQFGYKKDASDTSPGLGGRYNNEAIAIQIGTQTGYQTEALDRWQLEWERDGRNFRLTAPRAALTQKEFIQIAASLEPLP